jgi:hypothetical protein
MRNTQAVSNLRRQVGVQLKTHTLISTYGTPMSGSTMLRLTWREFCSSLIFSNLVEVKCSASSSSKAQAPNLSLIHSASGYQQHTLALHMFNRDVGTPPETNNAVSFVCTITLRKANHAVATLKESEYLLRSDDHR